MKIAFGMIVFNGGYVLKQVLDSVYEFADQILISEGPAKYWQQKGYTTSSDNTNQILQEYPDPKNKIKIHHGQYEEKDEQCNAYMKFLDKDIDYIWNLDSDEVYKSEDLETIKKLLHDNQYTSMGLRSCSFYGGFDRYIGGFEQNNDNFLRVFKAYPECKWLTHRPPTIVPIGNIKPLPIKHLCSDELYDKTGIEMYHYSYVFPKQVYNKINYYYGIGGWANRIPNYFLDVYYPWITGNDEQKKQIEKKYNGVHEYLPSGRNESFTKSFTKDHPDSIKKSMPDFLKTIKEELEHVGRKLQTH